MFLGFRNPVKACTFPREGTHGTKHRPDRPDLLHVPVRRSAHGGSGAAR